MPTDKKTTEQDLVKRQYRTADNLSARIRLHKLFSTNPYGWFPWYLDHLDLRPGMHILELGCGSAALWQGQTRRLPDDISITLTDASSGMIEQARSTTLDRRFAFAVVDAQAISFAEGQFDLVLANHMLYHIPSLDQALQEIRCVLVPGGRLYAATNGLHNLEGLQRWNERLDQLCGISTQEGQRNLWIKRFTLENGGEQLARHFQQVQMERYLDGLKITQAQPLVDYVLSMLANRQRDIPAEAVERFTSEIAEEITAKGSIEIPKEAGIWIGIK